MQIVDERMIEVFRRSEARAFGGNVLRITDDGIWLPTPLPILDAALVALRACGFWGEVGRPERATLLDAGMGDGRLVAALGRLDPRVHACGIESDPVLHALACENLDALAPLSWSAAHGSYLEPPTYAALGISIADIDAVFNYPDGNERALVDFWRARGRPGSHVVFVTPDRTLAFTELALVTSLELIQGFRVLAYRV